jgi:hypothetical protein
MERRRRAGQKTGRMPESRRRIRLGDARRPVPVMVPCERQAPRQARAGVAAIKVSRFVIVARPAARSGRREILFECPHRASCRSPSPTGQRNEIAPDVCRWFVRSSPRAVSRVAGRRKRLLLGMDCWPFGAASEPLLLRVAGERRGPAYWALWLPRRAAWRCCGASPDCFPCCVSSLVFSISGWPRILHVRLGSSFSR